MSAFTAINKQKKFTFSPTRLKDNDDNATDTSKPKDASRRPSESDTSSASPLNDAQEVSEPTSPAAARARRPSDFGRMRTSSIPSVASPSIDAPFSSLPERPLLSSSRFSAAIQRNRPATSPDRPSAPSPTPSSSVADRESLSPTKKAIPGYEGDRDSELYEYVRPKSAAYNIAEYLHSHRKTPMTITVVVDFQEFLFDLCRSLSPPGAIMAGCAMSRYNEPEYEERKLTKSLDLPNGSVTVGDFFSLWTGRQRKFYEPLFIALIHHHMRGAKQHKSDGDSVFSPEDESCGRCRSDAKKPFGSCRSVQVGGKLLLHGTCTNCYAAASGAECSMNRSNEVISSDIEMDSEFLPEPSSTRPNRLARSSRPSDTLVKFPPNALRSYTNDTIAWSKFGALDIGGDEDYEPGNKRKPVDLHDYRDGAPEMAFLAENSRRRKALEDANAGAADRPSKGTPQKSPSKRKSTAQKPVQTTNSGSKKGAEKAKSPAKSSYKPPTRSGGSLPDAANASLSEPSSDEWYSGQNDSDDDDFVEKFPSKRRRRG